MSGIIFIAAFLFLSVIATFAQTIERTQTPDFSSKPLTILSAPRVHYANSAGRKNIDEIDGLQIVFQADAGIGENTSVTERKRKTLEKYGSAPAPPIEAAKKIKFARAMKSVQPVTVVKTIVYGFLVY